MSRRHGRVSHQSTALAVADVVRLPGGCSSCLRWEQPAAGDRLDEAGAAKQRWWAQALARGSAAGFVVRADSQDGANGQATGQGSAAPIVAYISFAVPPRSGPDALTVLGLHVDESCRGLGVGRALVHVAARDALRRPRVRAVEARALRGHGRGGPGHDCLVPLDFWLACGCTVVRNHPVAPRVRLDAHGLAGWRTEVGGAVEQAWDRLRGAVRPRPIPGAAPGPALLRR